ncbi:MAG: RNA polymerase sigma factor [Planctomycetes bacterium]|nr:RNA polymerase sigma factor [Planctomycetota bacterium]
MVLGAVLQNVRRSLVRLDDAGQTDGILLDRFIMRRDEAAFAALVRRHGEMVLGVCRRVLRNEADAEDAFQAAFLVLVRRAGAIRPRGMVGNWLYGVAQNTARKAKVMNTRMRARERQAGARPKPEAASEDWQEQQALMDQELQALPDKYRAAIVLCDLEGKSIKEAARHLGCPPATIGTRLARGRSLLARRLARRGLTLSGGVIATVLSQNAASASVPLPLVNSTVKAASLFAAGNAASSVAGVKVAALTEGVLKAMLLTKLKCAMSVLLALGIFVAGAAYQSCKTEAAESRRAAESQPIQGANAEQTATQPAPEDEAANAQIAKFLKAHGSEDALRRLRSFTLTVNTASVISSQKDQYQFFIQLPNLARIECRADGDRSGTLVSVKNGDKRWQKVNDGEVLERGVADGLLEFVGPRALLRLKDPAMKVTMLGERMAGDIAALLGDRGAVCVELARKDGKRFVPLHALAGGLVEEVRLYFDKASGLLLKEEFEDRNQHIEIFCTDYKVFNDIPVAQKLVRRTDGSVNYRSTVEFNIVDKLDAKLFQKP